MIQAVLKGFGGTIDTYFLGARPTSCTMSLYTGDGAVKASAVAATVDTCNTVLASAPGAGDVNITLLSASPSVVVGRRYLIGSASDTEPSETVTVVAASGANITTAAPLLYGHSVGVAFAGTRVSYAVTSTQADVLWWDGYARWTPNTGDIQEEVVDCVLRKIPENLIDETDVRLVFPKVTKIVDMELDIKAALREARDEFLRSLGGKNRAYCALGADHFRRPTALTFWLMRRHAMGDEWAEAMDRIEKERDVMIAKIESQIPFDNDQDGTTTSQNDGGYTTIRVQRE